MLTGKIVRVPGNSRDMSVADGSTVGQVLQQAGMSPTSNEEVRLNAVVTSLNTVVTDGFRIMLTQGAKGNK